MKLSLWPEDDATIVAAGRALRAGRITCVGLVERCLAAIEESEPGVKAWVVVDPTSALRRARTLDERLGHGSDLGPLHGIPIGVKDVIDVRGLATKVGAQRWSIGPAEADAPVVADLLAGGAIVLGKTVTTAYAYLDPPPTRNPWNLERTPGGSSSGSAAAVATGMCLGAVGTQTVGSLTRPAAFCGVSSWKPSRNARLTMGVLPLAPSLDVTGFLARSIRDLALIESRFAGRQWLDGLTAEKSPRLGVLRGIFEDRAEPAMRAAMAAAIGAWSKAGASVVEIESPPGFADVWPALRTLLAAEAAEYHARRYADDPDDYPTRIAALIEEGLEVSAVDYLRANRVRGKFESTIGGWAVDRDALVVPAATGPAPGRETTGDSVFNAPWNFLDLPTLSIPIAVSADGLPVGVQVVGLRRGEREVFDAASWCERVIRSGPSHENERG